MGVGIIMAYFAELDSDNKVLEVLVFSNEDVDAHGGDLSPEAEQWVQDTTPHTTGGVSWKQTSYNGNFRKQYAGISMIYNSTLNMFVEEQLTKLIAIHFQLIYTGIKHLLLGKVLN